MGYGYFWQQQFDKVLHFAAGFLIYLIAIGVTKSIVVSLGFVAGIAIAKEIYDRVFGSGFDWCEVLAMVLGGFCSLVFWSVLR